MREQFRTSLHLGKKNIIKLDIVNNIIEEYLKQGYKLTLRQLYYQLVSRDIIPNRVTSLKEKSLSLEEDFSTEKNKKKRRVLEALHYYYEALIRYTIKRIIKEFNERVDIEVEESIPFIVSGGTSLPKGFLSLFKNVLSGYELPFKVSEIRQAKNPLTAVANGLLVKTIADISSK